MKLLPLLSILAALTLLSACDTADRSAPAPGVLQEEGAVPDGRLRIAVTIRPLALLVEALLEGVEGVEVHTLLPASADPHNFALRVSDRKALAEADLVLWVGSALERFLVKPMTSRPADEQVQMLTLAQITWPEPTAEDHAHDHHDHHDHPENMDPHVWLGPENARVMAAAIAQKLQALRPQQADLIEKNLQNFELVLQNFTAATTDRFQTIRKEPFAVHHNALGHFVQAFGLNQVAAVNNSPEERLGARQLESLRQEVAGARCLLVEAGAPAQRLAQALNLPMVEVDPLATSPQVTSYLQMLESLRQAVEQCLSAE